MSELEGAGFILRPGEGRSIELGGFQMSVNTTHHLDELAEVARTGAVDPEVLAEIASRYAMDVIGPVPDGYV